MDKACMIGVDVGGSHISAAWIDGRTGKAIEDTICKYPVEAQGSPREVIRNWAGTIRAVMNKMPDAALLGIGIAMPGPFDYERGVSLISGLHKYDRLLGLNVGEALRAELNIYGNLPIAFENDASCFGIGESIKGKADGASRVFALTLGTGFGSAFVVDGRVCREGPGVPPGGFLYSVPFKDKTAEDYLSARWLLGAYASRSGKQLTDVREVAMRADANDMDARFAFAGFGHHLGTLLGEWVGPFGAEYLVLGGSIAKAAHLFMPELKRAFDELHISLPVHLSDRTELAAMEGAASVLKGKKEASLVNGGWRKTTQPLMPQEAKKTFEGGYDLYPFHKLGDGEIARGYDSLAGWMLTQTSVRIDGYGGNDWEAIREHLGKAFRKAGVRVAWYETASFLKPAPDVLRLTEPFMGEPGSVWGRIADLELEDFYETGAMKTIKEGDDGFDLSIVLGVGAGLVHWSAPVIYVDLPKNEIQYRMRAGSITNLGISATASAAEMYKRFYFIDWVVLNRHRAAISDEIAVVADGQWKDDICWVQKAAITAGLRKIASSVFRVRPWFEAGAWGGQWMKKHISGLNRDEVNYAWSFELIVPENGLVFESSGNLLEIAFDWLMEQESPSVLGRDAAQFGTEFPIRFDFLDTFDGGNLSIQVHPSREYIRDMFGERITQDETYYILDCTKDAGVYLGFQDDIRPLEFRETLEHSLQTGTPVDIERFVQRHPAHRHDLFLIPNGTIHSSGKNNLVLEISATPYIYTFKMYDWLRLDLNGQPRPINIDHAFRNLKFDRKGEKVREELLSKPAVLEEREGFRLMHLPTHADHFYDVHRLEFTDRVEVKTNNQCHVLMVVEGKGVIVESRGQRQRFNYAETFVIPAAAESYTLQTEPGEHVKVVKAFVK